MIIRRRRSQRMKIEDFVDQLVPFIARKKSSLSVKVMVLSQILHRFIEPYEGYNENDNTLNKLPFQKINTLAYQNLKIFFWRHQCGLWVLGKNNHRSGGIHLSWNRGYPKYFRSVRDEKQTVIILNVFSCVNIQKKIEIVHFFRFHVLYIPLKLTAKRDNHVHV